MPDDSDKRRGRNLSEPVPSLGVPELPTGADTRAPTLPPPENSSIDPDLQETQIIGDEDLELEGNRLAHPVATRATTAVHTPALATGSEWGRYEVAECLGEGGMGVVYRALDRTLDRSVALKFIRQTRAPTWPSVSSARPGPRRGSSTPTCATYTKPASSTASPTSPCSTSRAGIWRRPPPRRASNPGWHCSGTWPARSTPPTDWA